MSARATKTPANRKKQATKAAAKKAANGGRFKPGQSGNPSGRPKVVGHVRELARAQTESAISTLIQVAENDAFPPAARVSAATALLDRGWGKAAQPIVGDDGHPPIRTSRELSEAELAAIAAGDLDG